MSLRHFRIGLLTYVLTLSPEASVTLNSQTSPIDSVQGFFALGATSGTSFSATGHNQNNWNFVSLGNNGFGWDTSSQSAGVSSPKSVTLSYDSLSVPGGDQIIDGLQVSCGSNGNTEYIKCHLPSVPELPAGLLAVLGASIASGFSGMRRRLAF